MSTMTLRHYPDAAGAPAGTQAVGERSGGGASPVRKRYRRQARQRSLEAALLTVVAWVLVATSLALWLATGGALRFTSVPAAFTQLGIAFGLTATATCLLMLLLAARIPLVDEALGQDRALAAHRALGFWTMLGLTNHALFLIAGSALAARTSFLAELASELGTGDLLLAALGIGGLVLVSVSSIAAARRHLGYEAWYVIHLLSYAAVGLSLPHQFSMGMFAANGPLRWFWLAFVAVTAFALLAFRVLLPVLVSVTHRMRVVAVEPSGPDAVTITVAGRNLAELGVRAGQFLHWRFWTPSTFASQHPFSVSAKPTSNSLRITVRNLGKGTARLQSIPVGTRVTIQGPYGIFTDRARTTDDGLVLLGAGIGVTPIRALLEETDVRPGAATVIVRASRHEELYLLDELSDLCRAKGAVLYVAVGPRATDGATPAWLPAAWRGASLPTLAPHVATSDVFVCGPQAWTDAVVAEARAAGVAESHIHDERFSW